MKRRRSGRQLVKFSPTDDISETLPKLARLICEETMYELHVVDRLGANSCFHSKSAADGRCFSMEPEEALYSGAVASGLHTLRYPDMFGVRDPLSTLANAPT